MGRSRCNRRFTRAQCCRWIHSGVPGRFYCQRIEAKSRVPLLSRPKWSCSAVREPLSGPRRHCLTGGRLHCSCRWPSRCPQRCPFTGRPVCDHGRKHGNFQISGRKSIPIFGGQAGRSSHGGHKYRREHLRWALCCSREPVFSEQRALYTSDHHYRNDPFDLGRTGAARCLRCFL